MYFIHISYMFSLHLYKNTEYSRVSPKRAIVTFAFWHPDLFPARSHLIHPLKWDGLDHLSLKALFRMKLCSVSDHTTTHTGTVFKGSHSLD